MKINSWKRESSMCRYASCAVAVMVLLISLLVSLSSCEKEVPDPGSESGSIALRFVLSAGSYDMQSSEVRSDGRFAEESETVKVLIEDDWYLYATLEADLSDRLRVLESIPNGTRVMIVAYDSGNNYVSSAEYEVNEGGLSPVTDSGYGIAVSNAGDYTFVAYSLNSTSVPSYSATVTIPANNDFLYGKTNLTRVNAGSNTISVAMKHLFSQVTVRAVATPSSISAVNGVSLSPSYNAGLSVQSGSFLKGSAGSAQRFEFTISPADTAVNSVACPVYTAGEPFSISIDSINIGTAAAMGPVSVTFNNTTLVSGKKYTLQLSFNKKVQFAASNIYWDGSKLTFDPYTTTPLASNMQKQGVVFKFASLVGISAARTTGAGYSGDAFVPGAPDDSLAATTTRIYVPYYKDSKEYLNGDTSKEKVWTATSAGARNWSAWINIPSTGRVAGSGNRYDDSVMQSSSNTEYNWKYKIGDICQFIDPAYRMPYSYEFGANDDYTTGKWSKTGTWSANNANGSVAGTTSFSTYATNISTGYRFPASGYRDTGNGALTSVYLSGFCWSGSVSKGGNLCYYMTVGNTRVSSYELSYYDRAFPVRCVKK